MCRRATAAGRPLKDLDGRDGIRGRDLLHDLDAFDAAVPLDFTLIGVERDPVQEAIRERRGERVVERRQDVGGQHRRAAVEAHAQVPPGIGIAYEEPLIDETSLEEACGEGPDMVDDEAVGRSVRAIEVRVEPLAAGREATPSLVDDGTAGAERPDQRRVVGSARERHDQLVGVPPLGRLHRAPVGRRCLDEAQEVERAGGREERVHAEHVAMAMYSAPKSSMA